MKTFLKTYLILAIGFVLFPTFIMAQPDYFGIYLVPNVTTFANTGNTTEVPTLWFSDNTNPLVGVTSEGLIGVSASISNVNPLNEPAAEGASSPHSEAMFGGQSNNDTKALRPKSIIVPMNDVGNPSSGFFSPTESLLGLWGLDVTSQYAFEQYISTEGLENAHQETDGRYFVGTITYTFTSPVDNPYFHVVGLGGFFSSAYFDTENPLPPTLLFSTDLEFIPNDQATGIEMLSGTPNTALNTLPGGRAGGVITNNYLFETYASNEGQEGYSGDEAGSGSFKIVGNNITEVVFDMYLKGKVPNQTWSTINVDPNQKYTGDRFNTTWTLGPEALLPVELLKFTAEKAGSDAILNWSTAEEIDFSHFNIERSLDGKTFEAIGKVLAKGSNSAYSFIDRNPGSGINYYRLKMDDIDGTYEYSDIRSVKFDTDGREVVIYPNPTSDKVFLERVPQGSKVSVLALDGRLISTSYADSQNIKHEISLNGNEAGVYLIEIDNNGVIDHHRIILVK